MRNQMIKMYTGLMFIAMLVGSPAFAQQEPMFTQYMFNGMAINPGYAGSHETISITALARKQWTGLEGAPNTQTFTAHMPLKLNTAAGISFTRDEIGITTTNSISAAFAYKVPMGLGKLSFGLQAGMRFYRDNFSKLNPKDKTDDVYTNGDVSKTLPDFGAGVYYYSDRFFLGISVPHLINQTIETADDAVSVSDMERHYVVYSGYVFDLSPSVKLKPHALLKVVEGAPVQMDINASVYLKEILGIGLSYRSLDSFAALLELQATPAFRLGYSYDFATTTDLRTVQNGSHEIMLNYRFDLSKKIVLTPRYF
ncbi:type IX secretion system membrane protein PorP/SprF [Rapidithrix thailandica]|uniref:Type IX secretion system membrane protein PorP/SprF n=1 Tax=Rapidithrix thailandica TaxID=413964 RepID=A0AAW9S2F9_9BACT